MDIGQSEQTFLAMLADVLEVASVSPEEDYRRAPLWGSLTAFSLKVTLQQKYGRALSLSELDSCSSAAELMGKVLQ